jgi:hypothetical protein
VKFVEEHSEIVVRLVVARPQLYSFLEMKNKTKQHKEMA